MAEVVQMHRCWQCGKTGFFGNLRSPKEVHYKCSSCVQGEVEYINNHPKDFPEAHLTMAQMNQRVKNENKRKRMQRRSSS
jgi:hypothetical protein